MKRTESAIGLAVVLAMMPSVWAADLTPPSNTPLPSEQGLRCDIHNARPGDTLHISLSAPHGGYLAIDSPTRERFLIIFPQPDAASPVQPSMPDSVFSRVADISFKIGDARGYSSKKNDSGKVQIFRQPGTYTVLVSPGLETDEPLLDGWCKIVFRP